MVSQWYQEAQTTGISRSFRDVGFRCYSQHDEDGILLYIFSLIGMKTRKVVEICCGIGSESNSANLIVNHRWTGLLFDGVEANTKAALEFFKNNLDTRFWPPTVVNSWLTRDNLNALIQQGGMSGEIDLLSIDVDGNDLWFWEALNVVQPRVLVTEINHLWGADRSVSTPYRDDFVAEFTQYGCDYGGASLPAFVKVSERKGYRLIGVNSIGTNAFFLRNDVECKQLPTQKSVDCFEHPRAQFGINVRRLGVLDKNWVEV